MRSLPLGAVLSMTLIGVLAAQTAAPPRELTRAQTGCDALTHVATDTVYDAESVDHRVEARRLPIEDMPFRAREVLTGRSVFQFIVASNGKIEKCSIELVEETTPEWTDAVVAQLRSARYQPARRGGKNVSQRVYQIFTYHQDGRLLHGR